MPHHTFLLCIKETCSIRKKPSDACRLAVGNQLNARFVHMRRKEVYTVACSMRLLKLIHDRERAFSFLVFQAWEALVG